MAITVPPDTLLLKSADLGGGSGELINVTAESADWEYTGLIVVRLAAGETWSHFTGIDEVALVPLGGKCVVEAEGHTWEIGGRARVFDGPPWAVYLPRESNLVVRALTPLELAVCAAQADDHFPARLIEPDQIAVEIRGAGNAARQINHIIPPDFPADRLLVVEVFTPSGNWSSFPPHKHDVDDLPNEALLEETYYHRLDPRDGFAVQRVYTDDGSLDETIAVGDGDTVLVPRGYHPVAASPRHDLYYLNVMAGPVRRWCTTTDPRY
jgi:5-deoxy-glucuronate isomerase